MLIWIAFILLILILLALDLGVFNRHAHVVSVKEALGWSALWISLGLLFSVFIYFAYQNHWLKIGLDAAGSVALDPIDKTPLEGRSATLKYLTGYVIEKSLSVDNIFVIAVIFAYFAVPAMYQHRVLFWGILGALIMRGLMIFLGAELIYRYHWIIWIFGAFLIFTGIRMLFMSTNHADPSKNPVVKLTRKLLPVTDQYHGSHFFVRVPPTPSPGTPGERGGEGSPSSSRFTFHVSRFALTPLALALIVIETTDLLFAIDSIPAIFAVTGDPFLIFTSNVFAILGLRSLYFALAGMMNKFRYLKASLAIVLIVVGIKMLASEFFKQLLGPNFNLYLLAIIFLILASGVLLSLYNPKPQAPGPP